MTSHQLESGYTRIINVILKALAKNRIPGVEMQLIFAIFLKTYSWGKKSAEIRINEFVAMTNLKKQHVSRALKNLQNKKIIIVTNNGDKSGLTYCFNKYSENWELSPKKVTNIKQVVENTDNNENKSEDKPEKPKSVTNNGDKSVTNNGDKLSPIMVTNKNLSFYLKEIERNSINKEREKAVILSKKYALKIQPLKRSYQRTISNLQTHFKKHSFEDLNQAVENYYYTLDMTNDPQYRKDPANFFGVNEKFFKDYLPENFEPPEQTSTIPMSKTTRHNLKVAQRLLERPNNGS